MPSIPRIKAVIVSVAEFPERQPVINQLVRQFSEIGISSEIFAGVNGRNIIMYDTDNPAVRHLAYEGRTIFYDRRPRTNGQLMTRGELGCAWSHIQIMEKLLCDQSYDSYLICEDDATLVCDLSGLKLHLDNIPAAFDLCRMSKSTWYPFVKERPLNDYFFTHARRYTNDTTSYIVSRSGAQKLLQAVAGTITIPADDLLSNTYIHRPDFISCIPETYLFHDPGTHTSLISQLSSTS